MKLPSVSVILSALNEEHTIHTLLKDILLQDESNYNLQHIFVATDGCTDDTARIIRSLSHPKIKLFEFSERKGKAFRITEIMEYITSDVVVFTDADVRLANKYVISELVSHFHDEHIGLVCGNHQALPPTNLIQHGAYTGLAMFNDLKNKLQERAIRYRCDGRLFALRGHIAKKIRIPADVATDTYTYYFAISEGYSALFAPKAVVLYSLPKTYKDYVKQTKRYMKDNVKKYFPTIYNQHRSITASMKATWFLRSLISLKYPLPSMLLFSTLYAVASLQSLTYHRGPLWQVSETSKPKLTHYEL